MYAAGVVPDEVTYSAALDAYARLGRRHQVAALYDRARAAGWRPDAVAFAVLARMYGEVADYDGIQFVLSEMRALGVASNAVVYNALLEALGKAGRPALAHCLFDAPARGAGQGRQAGSRPLPVRRCAVRRVLSRFSLRCYVDKLNFQRAKAPPRRRHRRRRYIQYYLIMNSKLTDTYNNEKQPLDALLCR